MLSRLLKGIQNKEKFIYRFIIVIVTLNVLMAVLIAIFGKRLNTVLQKSLSSDSSIWATKSEFQINYHVNSLMESNDYQIRGDSY